jgi:GH24 family phage-related lysozyme (muramidase)
MLNKSDFDGAWAQFGLWIDAGGYIDNGLVARRLAESTMFFSTPQEQKEAA